MYEMEKLMPMLAKGDIVRSFTFMPMNTEKSDSFLKKPLQTALRPSGVSSRSMVPSLCFT